MNLAEKIETIITEAGIDAGFALQHLESGEKLAINGDALYPMASVFKIPIMATAFHQWEKGAFKLDQRIALTDADKSIGSGILPFFDAGVEPTVYDLLTLMIIISDNTATDILVDLLGGAPVVEAYMRDIGLADIHFKMNCKELLKTLFPPDMQDASLEEIEAWMSQQDEPPINLESLAYARSPENNTSTASAMTQLNAKIYLGELGGEEARKHMLDILSRQQFNVRLSRFFPMGTRFDHKTGTLAGIRNNSGIMYVDNDNHVAMTLYTAWDEAATWKKPEVSFDMIFAVETAMGRIGKAVYEHYAS